MRGLTSIVCEDEGNLLSEVGRMQVTLSWAPISPAYAAELVAAFTKCP